jgi:lipopolysaccharide export system permease protein
MAQRGVVLGNAESKGLALRLIDGEIHYDSKDLKSTDTVQFKTYELTLDLSQFGNGGGPRELGESEIQLKELWQRIKTAEVKDVKYNMLVMELHEKFAVPFSCLILGFIGLSLAVQSRAYGYSAGVAMALGIFLVYYILLSAAKSFGESAAVPPALGIWMPNILLGALSLVMFDRACRETPMKSMLVLGRLAKQIRGVFQTRGTKKQ